jgi:uncharacterized protein
VSAIIKEAVLARDEKAEGSHQTLHAAIGGMHCINCAALIEDRLKRFPGVVAVQVDYPSASAVIKHTGEVDPARLNDALQADGYGLAPVAAQVAASRKPRRFRDFLEIVGAFVVLAAVALLLRHFQLLPSGLGVSDEMSYGLVILIGLVASVSSCLAVTGGLLVALAAKYNEANPYLSDRRRLTPHIYFNAGRIICYTLLGGAVGALGAALTPSPATSGALTLIASLIMIALGLNMLGLFPPLQHLLPRLPRGLSAKLHNAASVETKSAAFFLGGATFFLPCGFTQALQLYVLSTASFTTGALTMLAFALGTLPALLSLSAVSSLAKGAFQRHFLRFAGAGVILLGLINIQYGLVLTGSDMNPAATSVTAPHIANGTQRISMKVVGLEYQPHQLAVKQGVPVEWWIDGSEAAGCGRMLLAPGLQIRKLLSDSSSTLISFTPDRPGEFAFNCGMGMMTPNSKIIVIPNDRG